MTLEPCSKTPRPEPYYSYNRYLQKQFGGKTYKVVVASGLTCPTRDGTISKQACAFCDLRGSSSYFGKQGRGERKSATRSASASRGSASDSMPRTSWLTFRATPTLTPTSDTCAKSTRPRSPNPASAAFASARDRIACPMQAIELLEELAKRTYVSLELGIQSFENPTLEWLTRGHDSQSSIDALERLRTAAPHVHTCAHFIFGSPTDSPLPPARPR